jgi:hypothetical protein
MQQTHSMTTPDMGMMDHRSGDRFGIALPITMEDGEGETHDISETGILFETVAESAPQVGARIAMTLQYSMDGHDYNMPCEVEVVRVERVGNRVNVAARLLAPLHSEQ